MRIEKVRGNREGIAVSSHSHREMVFHRLEIRSKATIVAEIESKNVRGNVKTHEVVSRGAVLGIFVVPSPDGDSEAGCGEATIVNVECLNMIIDVKRVEKMGGNANTAI